MAELIVRDLDDDVILRLEKRAAAHGRSVEAEHRVILEAAVRAEEVVVRKPAEPPIEVARRFQRECRDTGQDSAELIREFRDERAQRLL